MRIALAAVFQLTNSFSRQVTHPADFGVSHGTETVRGAVPNLHSLVAAIVEAGDDQSIPVLPVLVASARSAGPVTYETTAMLHDSLAGALRDAGPGIDALVLVVSGSLLDQSHSSVDALLLDCAKRVLPDKTPVVVLAGNQGNLSDQLVDGCDLLLGIQLSAWEPFDANATKTLKLASGLARRELHPTRARRRLPLLIPPLALFSRGSGLAGLRRMAADLEQQPGVLDVSLFEGFPYADVADARASVTVTSTLDGPDPGLLAERLKREMWDVRHELQVIPANVETVIHDAMLVESGPVVILDSGDDPAYGAAADGTGQLWALIDLGAPQAALGVVVDRSAVDRAIAIGVGGTGELDLGGSLDRRAGYSIPVKALVRRISDGMLRLEGNREMDLGRAVVLAVQGRHGGTVEVIVSEKSPPYVDAHLFAALGIDLSSNKIVGVKSSGQSRESFLPIATRIFETSTPGITTPVLAAFDYRQIRRPIYPLDPL